MDRLLHALARAANALAHSDIPFAVAGGCAVWARGGPATDHDVDLFVRPEDSGRARSALARAGLRVADAAEDWLTKAYDGDILIDIVHRPNDRDVTGQLLARAEMMRVGATTAPVVTGTDLLVDKLLVCDDHRLDLSPLLQIARALREQVHWPQVRERTAHSPYARAFLGLIDDLGIADTGAESSGAPPQYVAAKLHRLLAEDPEVAEPGVRVRLRGDTVLLDGAVATAVRRERLEEKVREAMPRARVRNDVLVTGAGAPDHEERLP
ncbi:hypothetical protein IU433_04545 [Nocardia puris]|nr:nucleotidyltransferase family protein [Nocardia puris]MBF6209777.1 hypothetical protein [Nocardia puris]MBF6366349.1 hypothetical protein [Nocardia puris]MBF6458312.1 hypothetical protein [Nocardia puris]